MEEESYKKIVASLILFALIILSFFMLRPLLISIILGIILGFILMPVYEWIATKTKSKYFSAFFLCFILIVLIVLFFWILSPIFVNQSLRLYLAVQQADLITPLQSLFPSLFKSGEFSTELASIFTSFIEKIANSAVNVFTRLVLNAPIILLQSLVMFFSFFYILRDKDKFLEYIKSLLPFSEEIQKKIFKQSKEITFSVIYGQVVIGFVQGVIAGIGFFIFGVPNSLLMTLLAIIAGVLPIIGTTVVWIPILIYLLLQGSIFPAIGVAFFGSLSSLIENLLKPTLVSRRTEMHSSLVLFGMIGGLFFFGFLGVILGPLILAYLLIIVETYRHKKNSGFFTHSEN